jgi:hypothetical protein
MKIFAGGSLVVSGITGASRQLSVGFCAITVIAHNTMAATDSRDAPFELIYFRFSMFFLHGVGRGSMLPVGVAVLVDLP